MTFIPCWFEATMALTSVTRLGEFSPLWQNLQSLGQFFEGLFIIWQNFGPTLANWENFRSCKWLNV